MALSKTWAEVPRMNYIQTPIYPTLYLRLTSRRPATRESFGVGTRRRCPCFTPRERHGPRHLVQPRLGLTRNLDILEASCL